MPYKIDSEGKVLFCTFKPEIHYPPTEVELGITYNIMQNFIDKATKEFNLKLKEYIIDNLKQIGYEFTSENEFFEFCRVRVKRLCFNDKPNYYELYINYENEENTGTLIGIYSDKVETKQIENKLTITIG